jgi:hypothetical protein
MSSPVSVSELRDTVTRMEERFRHRGDSLTVRLMAAYDKLIPRFRSDLNDERDELLSRGGALMLIQEVSEAEA